MEDIHIPRLSKESDQDLRTTQSEEVLPSHDRTCQSDSVPHESIILLYMLATSRLYVSYAMLVFFM